MSDIRKHVLAQPLFDTHEHQEGFGAIERGKERLDYRALCGFVSDDLRTAGAKGASESTDEEFWSAWRFVCTTGYGQATELACRTLFDIGFTPANAARITEGLLALTAGRTGRQIYEHLFNRAGIRWAVCDEWWTSPTAIRYFTGAEHPESFGHALRYDKVIGLSERARVLELEAAMGVSLQSLRDLDRALDAHAEKANAAGGLVAMKSAIAYQRRLRFDDPSFPDAERVFDQIMQGRIVEAAPLASYLFHRLVQRARDFAVPVQIHTGTPSHNRLDPTQGDPTGLIPVFQRYPTVKFDLFHAGWPFCELMGAIGKSFPNVWLDLCWAWTVSPVSMERTLDEWLGAVPNNKILGFGGDTGTPYPTAGYAMQARRGIASVLERKLQRGEYDEPTARQVADRLLYQNACELYRTPWS
jgi:uncharacterized protein